MNLSSGLLVRNSVGVYRLLRGDGNRVVRCERGWDRWKKRETEAGSRQGQDTPLCMEIKSLCSTLNSGLRSTAARDWEGRILERGKVEVQYIARTREMQVDKERKVAHLVDWRSGQA